MICEHAMPTREQGVEGVTLNPMQPTPQPMCSCFAPTAAKEETDQLVLFLDHINSHVFPLYYVNSLGYSIKEELP